MAKTLQLERYVTLAGIVCLLSTKAWPASTRLPTEECTRQSDSLTCTGTIPPQVPQGIREVTMLEINDIQFRKIITDHLFCDVSWSAIERLSISDGQTKPYIYHMYDNMFECLSNLTTLKLTILTLDTALPDNTFVGLEKVTTLDMSNCENLSPKLLFKALNDSKNLPNLSKLVLHKMNTINGETNTFTKEMFQALSRGRNITQLDMSNTRLYIEIVYNVTPGLCQTLNVLNISGVRLIHGPSTNDSLRNVLPCYSLETVDISGWMAALQDTPERNVSIANKYIYTSPQMVFWKNIKTLNASNINAMSYGNYAFIYNSTFNMSILYKLKHLDGSNNKFKYLDCALVSEYSRLESLDLSQNDMEYLAPRVFQQTTTASLRRLVISQNMLWHMESNQTEFETMFINLIHLESLRISHNNLSKIPKGMFVQNKNIQHLDMSNNKLTRVSFDMDHLINLRYFDISGNSFVNVDTATILVFNHIYSVQMNNNSVHLKVNLHNNPLQCSECSDLDFAEWMTVSAIVDNNHEGYVCETETETRAKKPFDRGVVNEIHFICDRSMILRRTVLLATLIPVAAITMLVIAIRYALKLVRKKRDDAHVEKIRWHIENNAYEFKYPVFLSYSSLDDDIVLNNLYEHLQHHLRVFCRTDRDLVCIGDRHFRPGRWIFDEVSRCLEMSALLVVVMSNNYCHSDWCIAEMQQAYQQHKQMLLIFIENVDEEDMHPILRDHFLKRVRVKFCNNANGDYVIQPEWDTVCSSIIGMLP